AVERELARPAAARLAGLNPEELTVVTVRAGDDALSVDVRAPGWAAKVPTADRGELPAADRTRDIRVSLDAVREQVARLRPAQPVVSGRVTPEQERYFALKELADEIAAGLDAVEARLDDARHLYLEARQPEAVGRRPRYRAIKYGRQPDLIRGWEQPFRSVLSALNM